MPTRIQKQIAMLLESSPVAAAFDLAVVHAAAWIVIVSVSGAGRSLPLYGHLLPLLSFVALFCFSVCGLYRNWSRRAPINLLSNLLMGQALYTTAWMSLTGWEPGWSFSRGVLARAALLQLLLLAVVRMLLRAIVRSIDRVGSGVAVAGDEASALALARKLTAAHPAWLASSEALTASEFLARPDESLPWGSVLIDQNVPQKLDIVRKASRLRKRVLLVPGVLDLWTVSAHLAEADDLLLLTLSPPYLRPAQRSIKRLIDVAGALCLLAVASPAMILAALAVRLGSHGPVFYRQRRVGANGREYTLYKFRTMIDGAERLTGPVLASTHDPRVTAAGRFLRATRIDELPQLVNVLAGQMSLVGPRPERPHFVRQLCEQVPGYELRMAVKPGITGLAQVYGRYSTEPGLKLRFDLIYIYDYSLLLDLRILCKTVLTVLRPSRAAGVGEQELTQ